MAEYIEREKAKRLLHIEYAYAAEQLLDEIPAADVAPVVRCKDCIYTRKLYGRLVCKYGTCSGCIIREDFFCANGERRASDGE